MPIGIIPSVVEFSLLVPALNHHFEYHNKEAQISIDCTNGTLIINRCGTGRFITLKCQSDGITVTLYTQGMERQMIDKEDGIPYTHRDPVQVLAGRVFKATNGDERRTNVQQLIRWLESDDV